MLRIILDKTEIIYERQPYLECLFKVMFTMLYYGMVRVGEIMDSPNCLTVDDVHSRCNKDKIQIALCSSKTHSSGDHPQIIKITAMDNKKTRNKWVKNKYFSFRIIRNFVNVRDDYETENEAFFIFQDANWSRSGILEIF